MLRRSSCSASMRSSDSEVACFIDRCFLFCPTTAFSRSAPLGCTRHPTHFPDRAYRSHPSGCDLFGSRASALTSWLGDRIVIRILLYFKYVGHHSCRSTSPHADGQESIKPEVFFRAGFEHW